MSTYIPFSKTEILRDIRAHCRECNGGAPDAMQKCTSRECRFKKYLHCNTQIDLFDSDRAGWINRAKGFIDNTMPVEFWWSDLRHAYDSSPPCGSWWGALASVLICDGWVRVDKTRPSTAGRSNGRREFLYRRKNTII